MFEGQKAIFKDIASFSFCQIPPNLEVHFSLTKIYYFVYQNKFNLIFCQGLDFKRLQKWPVENHPVDEKEEKIKWSLMHVASITFLVL